MWFSLIKQRKKKFPFNLKIYENGNYNDLIADCEMTAEECLELAIALFKAALKEKLKK